MKRIAILFLCLLMVTAILAGCAEEGFQVEDRLAQIAQLGESPEDDYRVWYEIFVYSYCDSDGDGIGDLNGVRQKLPELEAMGIGGIWLMPIHPSTTYHKYNVSDYYAIDPDYGTMEDFDALIAECEQRGIRVIMDLVVNHTGSEHPWFRELTKYLYSVTPEQTLGSTDCPYVDYYNLRTSAASGYRQIGSTGFYYECMFSSDMPDLNLGSQAVQNEIKSIMEFWLNKGVAGFRLDAVKEFYSGKTEKNIEVLKFLQDTAQSIKPGAYMVAEVWDSFGEITRYYESGITSIFDYPFGNSNGKIISVLRGAGNDKVVSTYAPALEKADKAYLGSNPRYIDAPFLSNHDVGRIAGFVNRNEEQTKLAGAMNLFMSGSAFVYYGEEIGMIAGAGDDPSKRAPMYWNAERNEGTTKSPPGCKLPESYVFGSLAEQKEDVYSIYNYYRQAIAIRNALPVISHGRTTAETALNQGCVSAQRKTWGEESCIILMNISEETAQVDLSAYAEWRMAATLSVAETEPNLDGASMQLPAYGVAVLIPNK